MYAVYEQASPRIRKSRAFSDVTFATLQDAVDFFAANGGFAEIDEANDAADAFTKGGLVLTVERL